MRQNFGVFKSLIVAFVAFVLMVEVYLIPALARSQSEKVEAISELVDEINNFYLHPEAEDFMHNFYTRESYENLREAFSQAQNRKIPNWETELDDATLTELYQLLRSAVTNLRPHIIRRGEAISYGQDLNFRAIPRTGTQVLYTLAYGTHFEILEEVQGGVVVGDDGSRNYRWFRIRHDNQSGYVHSRYVRDLPVSTERIDLLANIGRQKLLLQSKIDGWRIDYSFNTRNDLREILRSHQAMQTENWQFEFNYSELNDILQSLSYEQLNLVTLFRYNLINDIVRLKGEIENNIQGTGSAKSEDYTDESWENMYTTLIEAQELLSEGWQYNLDDVELKSVYELLYSGLNGLELIPQPEKPLKSDLNNVDLVDSDFDIRQILILGGLSLAGFIGISFILKIKKFIQHRTRV